MIIMRPSHKQHVGLLPDDISRGPKLSKSLSCAASLDSAQPLSSYCIDALASRLSPHTRTSAVTIPRQLAPTVGPRTVVLSSWRDLSQGFKKFVNFRMKKNRFGRVYVCNPRDLRSMKIRVAYSATVDQDPVSQKTNRYLLH